jgi:hypothetical protein
MRKSASRKPASIEAFVKQSHREALDLTTLQSDANSLEESGIDSYMRGLKRDR